jgi:predicted dehydrogenase
MMDKVNWGVLGTAGIAEKHTIKGMQLAANCNLYAIAGRNPEKTARFKNEFGFTHEYHTYEDLLNDENIQAVYIPLPNNLHKEWVLKAAAKGKHILCEKPLSGNAKDTAEMIEACNQNHCILMEAFADLHSPFIKKIKEITDSGEIGTLSLIEASFYVPRHPLTNIRMKLENLGGSIYDLGCYNTSLALTMLDREPVEVKALGHLTPEGIDDYATIHMDFGGGVVGISSTGMVLQPGQRKSRFAVYGTKGMIDAPDYLYNDTGELSFYVLAEGVLRTEQVFSPHNYMLEVEQMGECILSGQQPFVTHRLSLANAEIIDKALAMIGYGSV